LILLYRGSRFGIAAQLVEQRVERFVRAFSRSEARAGSEHQMLESREYRKAGAAAHAAGRGVQLRFRDTKARPTRRTLRDQRFERIFSHAL
jgi:hypothetical protein